MRRFAGFVIAVGAILSASPGNAQTNRRAGMQDFPQGSISGRVRTVGGTALSGASVEIINTQTSEKRTIAAGDEGVFRISGLQLGRYRIIVRAQGYLEKIAPEVELIPGGGQELDLALKSQKPDEPVRAVIPF